MPRYQVILIIVIALILSVHIIYIVLYITILIRHLIISETSNLTRILEAALSATLISGGQINIKTAYSHPTWYFIIVNKTFSS